MTKEQFQAQKDEVASNHQGSDVEELEYTLPSGEKKKFIALRPTLELYEKFLSETMDETKRIRAMKNLTLACVKFPVRADLNSFLAKFPAAVLSLAGSLLKAAGATGEAELNPETEDTE